MNEEQSWILELLRHWSPKWSRKMEEDGLCPTIFSFKNSNVSFLPYHPKLCCHCTFSKRFSLYSFNKGKGILHKKTVTRTRDDPQHIGLFAQPIPQLWSHKTMKKKIIRSFCSFLAQQTPRRNAWCSTSCSKSYSTLVYEQVSKYKKCFSLYHLFASVYEFCLCMMEIVLLVHIFLCLFLSNCYWLFNCSHVVDTLFVLDLNLFYCCINLGSWIVENN